MAPNGPAGDERIAFVGLGMMGAPMAAALARAGRPVTVYDVDTARARTAAADEPNLSAADSPDALAGATLLITMLPTSDIVEAALLGPDGIAARLTPGALVIDMSSSVPERTVRLGAALAESGISLVDAPVSGGVARAVAGTLTIMAGGEPDAVRRATPVLETMAARVIPVGGLGSGHAAKALNNVLSACGLLIATEVTEVARRFGLDPGVFLDLVNSSTGRNDATENKIAKFVLSEAYNSGFAAQLMAKDLRIADELATSTGARTALLHALNRAWHDAIAELPPGADQTEVGRYLAAGRPDADAGAGAGAGVGVGVAEHDPQPPSERN